MWTLLGVGVLVAGFLFRLNPLIVIALAACVTGVAGHLNPFEILSAFGKAFNTSRYVSVVFVVLPVIGLLEREGLQERARILIAKVRAATAGRILLVYMVFRQITAAMGLTSLGGHPQMVRPLVAPMAEAAAEAKFGQLSDKTRYRIRAYAASGDNVGVFFGEDIFIAMSSILLIKGFMDTSGMPVAPLQLSLWAIPTAILAFFIHGTRLLLLDRRIARDEKKDASP